jgi:hypothetical protein
MKIIGESERTFILEANHTEVARLIGFFHQSTDGAPRNLRVGLEIRVSAMYERLYYLEQSKGELERMAKQLRAQADLLESIDPVIQAATKDPKEAA